MPYATPRRGQPQPVDHGHGPPARALGQEDLGPASEVLEIGTGTGEPALRAADTGAHVTAVDVSWLAVLTARLNAPRRRIPLRVVHGDFAGRVADHRYDLVVSNPPYVPAPSCRLPSRGPQRAWDAGPDRRTVIDRICGGAPRLVRPGGVLLKGTPVCAGRTRPSEGRPERAWRRR
ncbi:methyltransferase [Streptomyces virginiae]|uniref:methyltransferase n=1 Tax=Streptomyces virginiae TaxID=1961 RepID=UPI003653AC05